MIRRLAGRAAVVPSLLVLAAAIVLVALVSPPDKTLGDLVRVVYVHGAVIQVALVTFVSAGLAGLAYLATGRAAFYEWSQALERAGLVLWIPYVASSVVTMVQAWGGIAWFEPRWVFALQILIAAPLAQVAGALIRNPRLSALLNAGMAGLIVFLSSQARLIMHPSNPVGESNSVAIKVAYDLMLVLWALAAVQLTRGVRALAGARRTQ